MYYIPAEALMEGAMSAQDQAQLKAALYVAVTEAIKTVGVATFKGTSLFGSNERVALQKAA